MMLSRSALYARRGILIHHSGPKHLVQRSLQTSPLYARPSKREDHLRWSLHVSATAITLALLASVGLFNGRQTIHAEAKQTGKTGPTYKKDDLSLLCLIGYPQSGKSTQAAKLQERWGKDGWQTVKVNSLDELRKTIEGKRKKGEQLSLIVDGFPRSWEEAQAVEREICEIFCYAWFNLEQDDWIKRTKGKKEEYKKLEASLKPLREGPREKANILEITAGWPEDEVYEQVDAKVESVFELRERGEL